MGNVYLKTALVEAAHAAARAKGTYLREKFYRLKVRATNEPPWRWLTRSCWLSIICFPTKSPTTTWEMLT